MQPKDINWKDEKRLGKMPDNELAELLGVSTPCVHQARTRLRIPPYRPKGIVRKAYLTAKEAAVLDAQRTPSESRSDCLKRLALKGLSSD